MTKRICALILILLLLPTLSLTGCKPEKDPDTPQTHPIVLYLPNENADGFISKAAVTDGTVEDIIKLLIGEKAIPEGCVANSFNISDKNGTLDMNAAFGQAVNQQGTAGEYLLLGSLINTLLTYFQLDTITLTVNGETLESGHIIYDSPLKFYKNQSPDFSNGSSGNNQNAVSEEKQAIANAIAALPRSDALNTLWQKLEGYWNSPDNRFVGFIRQNGEPAISYGLWESSGPPPGVVTSGKSLGVYVAELTIRIPATPPNELDGGNPAMSIPVTIDLNYFASDNTISVKITNHGDSTYQTYRWGGKTSDEALANK
jgi:hypothetical protein